MASNFYQDHNKNSTILKCFYCPMVEFKIQSDFIQHLRERHCTKEGGSYVCRYGFNGVCPSLPLDGVSDRDYETHVAKYHVNQKEQYEPLWDVFSAAQNLPAVLNDPSKGKQTNLFTKKWGVDFVERTKISPCHLPEITWNDFEQYQKKIGKRYRKHQRIVHQGREPHDEGDISPSKTNISSHTSRLNDPGHLSDIPKIFMKQDLELNNPHTFATVFPGIDNLFAESKQSGRLLQEKLSHYLDIVEVQISKQVSQKSSAFFRAMTSQDKIMEEMNKATENVKLLRNKIQNIDGNLVKGSLNICLMARTRKNYQDVADKLKLMATVQQTQPMIQLLLRQLDYVGALDLICTTQEICAQELIGIHSFRHLPLQLKEMEKLIDKMLTQDFERYAIYDLNRPFSDEEQVVEEDKLVCIIMGLLREKNFNFIDLYKEEAIVAVKAILKQIVIEVISVSDAEICLTGAGEEAQSLSIPEWIQLLGKATITLTKLLERVRKVHIVMQETIDASSGKISDTLNLIDSEVFLTNEDHKICSKKLKDLLADVCNYCHERCANLMSMQSLEKSVATVDELKKLVVIVNEFNEVTELISGNSAIPLNSAVKVQASRFVNKFHSEKKSKLALLLDSERWKQVDIPNEFQKIIDRISNSEYSAVETKEILNGSITNPVLVVDGKPYALVGVVLLMVQIVTEYCKLAEQLPILTGHLSRDVIDLLRTFNSRCCQLVLGAGAFHTAGLKTITSGNLALVSRALQLILWLLPKVKLHFQKFDNSSTAGYDVVEKDYISHIKEIENKVLTIVTILVQNQLNSWDARPPVPSQSFRNISRHLVKLHEAIAQILPEQQIHSIYKTVHKNFKDKLREMLLKYNIINNGGPQHGTVTSELTFYMETLRTLKALPKNELDDSTLEDIWIK